MATGSNKKWTDDQTDLLLAHMAENHDLLYKPSDLTNRIKEEVFGNDEAMTLKRIKDKMGNLKKSWAAARRNYENQS
jgi:hypothetical protein